MESQFLDSGVVLFQTGDGSGTFVDGGGRVQNCGQLSTIAFVDGAIFQTTRARRMVIAVHMARGGHMTDVHVKLLQRRDDRQNAGLFGWAPVGTFRLDTLNLDTEQVLGAADGADVDLVLELTAPGSFKLQVEVVNDGTPVTAADKVAIGVASI